MEWTLRLVGMEIDGQPQSVEVMAISRPDGLGEIANLGLTLTESKLLLAQVQQQLVAEQANTHATFRPDCQSCGETCQVKDWQPHRIATLFGEVRLKRPRFLCAGCGCGEAGVSWPSHWRDLMSVSGPEKPGREVRPGLCPGPAKGTALGTSLSVFAASV